MPTTKSVMRPDLGAIAYEYSATGAKMGFIGQLVLPEFPVLDISAKYPVIRSEVLLEVVETARAARGAYARGDWDFDEATYNCTENGYEEPLDDTEAKRFRNYFDAEVVAVQRATSIVMRSHERRVAAKVFNPAVFAPHAVGKAWNSYDDADPLTDVTKGIEALRLATGMEPNALILDKSVLRHVSMCQAVIERIKYSSPDAIRGQLTQAQLCAYFGVERILAAGSVSNTAPKKKDKKIGPIWSPTMAMLAVVSSGGMDLKEPSIGRSFRWEEDSPEMLVTEEYREESIRSNVYRVRQHTDECVQFAAAGYLLSGVIPAV